MIEAGAQCTVTHTVMSSDLASAIGVSEGDVFPPVLATARMVALMEIAAARLMQPMLNAGQLSVGVSLEVQHSAPTPPCVEVNVTATYDGPDGKLHRFTIDAADPGGPIGSASHVRAIVDAERLVARAESRR
jgi:fluoroacetyl-CoA thioesterase